MSCWIIIHQGKLKQTIFEFKIQGGVGVSEKLEYWGGARGKKKRCRGSNKKFKYMDTEGPGKLKQEHRGSKIFILPALYTFKWNHLSYPFLINKNNYSPNPMHTPWFFNLENIIFSLRFTFASLKLSSNESLVFPASLILCIETTFPNNWKVINSSSFDFLSLVGGCPPPPPGFSGPLLWKNTRVYISA